MRAQESASKCRAAMKLRLGVDIGGTKIAVAVLDASNRERLRRRVFYERREYDAALALLLETIKAAEHHAGERCTIGVGMPGLVDPQTGLVENAYNTPFNKGLLKTDLQVKLEREIRFANDANCFALSEAVDGAARGARVVFGAILGTGVGGGIVIGGRIIEGRHGIAGEWGHTPLPWMTQNEYPGPRCNCGRLGCIEQFLSGPAKNQERDVMGEDAAMARYEDRLARAFSTIINVLDPDVIVVGGGLSKHERLYANVPPLLRKYVYWRNPTTPIVRAIHGDASGVRGAAMLWPP
jgi:fructokinase